MNLFSVLEFRGVLLFRINYDSMTYFADWAVTKDMYHIFRTIQNLRSEWSWTKILEYSLLALEKIQISKSKICYNNMLAYVNIQNQYLESFNDFWRFSVVLFDLESLKFYFKIIRNVLKWFLIILDHEFHSNHNQIKAGRAFFSKMNLILS